MKNIRITGLLFFALLFITTGFTSCNNAIDSVSPDDLIVLTEDEKANLLLMREEEKLARDVYLYFYEKYGLNIYSNIASSEQTHMNAVLGIMEKYGIEDPASNELGKFTNVALQQLYTDLIAQGDSSLIEALKVGATIEDVDIRDLGVAISETTKTDILDLFEKLECGSRNHLRAFTSQLDSRSETYTTQFITQEQYHEIINGSHEHCGM